MKNLITTMSLLLTFFSINFDSKAAIITAIVNNGNWNSPATWDSGTTPSCGDTIEVPTLITVKVTANVDLDDGFDPLCPLVRINIAGRLRFSHGVKINLALGACINLTDTGLIIESKTGGGTSEAIKIDGVTWWKAGDGALAGPVQMGCSVLLPVSLIDFLVDSDSRSTNFTWTISSENNINSYLIEKSFDGINWETIGNINSIGNHSNEYTYSFSETNESFNEITYFKLHSISTNGYKNQLTITNLVQTKNLNSKEIEIFPNPVANNSMINIMTDEILDEKIDIYIYNQLGKVVQNLTLSNQQNSKLISIENLHLISGSYIIVLDDGKNILKSKFNVL